MFRAAIDKLPAPDPAVGIRLIRVSLQGHLLGVARDEFDVEYLQLFRLEGATAVARRLTGPDAAYTPSLRPVSEDITKTIMPAVRELMSRQEVFYSKPINEYRYANDVRDLENWQPIKGLISHAVFGGSLGWLGLIVNQQSGLTCGVEVGGLFFFPQPPAPANTRLAAFRIAFCE